MKKRIAFLLTLASVAGFHQEAQASGFALIEQSVSSMGNAYAGGAAVAEDATTIFFNPAGLTRLCGGQVIAGAHVVIPVADYDDQGSILNPLIGSPPAPGPTNFPGSPPFYLSGNDGRDAGEAALVGNFYLSKQINNCLWAGFAVTSPFGLVTDYDDDWKGRYHALRSSLLTVDLNPVLAYKVNNCLSIGGGLRAVYAHAKLTSAVDYGTIAWLNSLVTASPALTRTALDAAEFLPEEQDGRVQLKGNAWGFGGNVGVLYEPCCGTRFGFNWRSQVKLKIKGTEKFSRLPTYIADPSQASPYSLDTYFAAIQAAAATDTKAKSDVVLPDLFQISGYHEINNCWAVMADISWTRWKLLRELRFKFDNPNQADGVTTLRWQNSMRYSLGATYRPSECWVLRSGIAYDETPIKSKEYRTPRIPDQDRFWVALGAGYDWSCCLHFDIAYAHLFVREPKIDKTDFALDEDAVRGGLKGKYDAYTDIISAQVVWSF